MAASRSSSPARPQGRAILTIASVMILIGVEVFGVAVAGAWALAGLLELGEILGYALMAAFSVFGLYIMVLLWRRAVAAESGR